MNENTKEILEAIDNFQKENYKFHIETHRKQSETNGRLLGAENKIIALEKVDLEMRAEMGKIKIPNLDHIKTELTKNSTDLKWIKKTHWVVVSASVGTLIAAVAKILFF